MVALLSVVVFSLLLSFVHCNTTAWIPLGPPIPPASNLQLIQLTDKYPATRHGAVMGMVPTTAEGWYGFVILGGTLAYGDDTRGWVYKVDENKTVWKELNTKFSVSNACYVQVKDVIYIYGGTEAGTNYDLYQYQISKDTMTKINIAGDAATKPPTQGTTCGIVNGTLYVVGGDCTSQIFSFDTTAKEAKWVNLTVDKGPLGRKGASGLIFGDEFVMWGGNCKGDETDVWRFNLVTKVWNSDKATSERGPDARAYHSAVVDGVSMDESFIIFGGEVNKQTMNDTWIYDLKAKNWTLVNPYVVPNKEWPYIAARQNANAIYVYGRMFIFSGLVSPNTTANDFWELSISSDCYQLTSTCGTCVITDGCGWCSGNLEGYRCIPGRNNMPYVNGSCWQLPSPTYTNDLCPPEGFPGWIIALIIVITILAIGIVWYFVIRCQKKSSGYDQIN